MGKLSGVVIHEGLVVVDLNGFDTPPETCIDEETGAEFDAIPVGIIDPPGSANWLCEQYGMGGEEGDGPGILHTDYDSSSDEPWRFSVLVDADESEDLQDFARKAGYEVISAVPVAEPMVYGDGSGTVEILKHRDGWVVLDN